MCGAEWASRASIGSTNVEFTLHFCGSRGRTPCLQGPRSTFAEREDEDLSCSVCAPRSTGFVHGVSQCDVQHLRLMWAPIVLGKTEFLPIFQERRNALILEIKGRRPVTSERRDEDFVKNHLIGAGNLLHSEVRNDFGMVCGEMCNVQGASFPW